MKLIEMKHEVVLHKDAEKKLLRKLGVLRGLAKMVRTDPFPWTEDGKLECSLLGELEDCQAVAQAILRRERDPEVGLAQFEFRFEAIVRAVFAHQADVEAELRRQELESAVVDVDWEAREEDQPARSAYLRWGEEE